MKSLGPIRLLFVFSGLYDAVIGAAFVVAGPSLFSYFNIAPPNHFGYVRFPALLLVVFGMMFFAVAARPQTNRNLIPYGIGLKLSYGATVVYYWMTGGVPNLWKPFAIADLLFIALFAWAYAAIGRGSSSRR